MTPRALFGMLVLGAGAGWLTGRTASAQETVPSRHLLCRTFQGASNDPEWVIDTSDRTSEVGQWVGKQANWQVESIDFEVGTKPTGYPSTWAEVCLSQTR